MYSNKDVLPEDLIICPYCKHEDKLSYDDLGESNTDYEKHCDKCEKEFVYHYETEIRFFSDKLYGY